MLAIDRIAYTSRLTNVAVSEKLMFIALPLLCALFIESNLLNLAIIAAFFPITVYFAKLPCSSYLRLLILPAGFIMLSILTICIVPLVGAGTHVIWTFELLGTGYAISSASLQSGIQLFTKSLAAISCLYFFALNTPINSLLAYLQSLGVSGLLLTLMEFIYRFIFIIYEQACVLHTAQASRLGHGSLLSSLRAYYQLFTCVFVRSLGRVDRINNALLSRGFDNNFQHFAMQQEHSPKLQKLTWLCAVVLIGSCLVERGWL